MFFRRQRRPAQQLRCSAAWASARRSPQKWTFGETAEGCILERRPAGYLVAQGKQAAEWWGKLFNVEVTWFDGQLDAVKQRAAIDNMASQKWDFVAIRRLASAR